MIIAGPGTIVNSLTGERVLAGVSLSVTGACGEIDEYTLYLSVYAHKKWIQDNIDTV